MNHPLKHVGYIGLGIMGGPMAANLGDAGYRLTVWNRTAAKAEPFRERGADVAASPADVAARDPEVIFLNVIDTADVEAVLFGTENGSGVVDGAQPGLIVIDNSTISPIATRAFAERLTEHDVTLIDAPVSGGDVGARNGTLSIMVGGPDDVFARVRPLLDVLGSRVTHLGPTGAGQACKACNQIAVACNLLGVVEAMAMAASCEIDMTKMIEVVSDGAGGSWQMANLAPKIAAGDFEPGFMIDYLLKDLGIVAETAREKGLTLSVLRAAEACFRAASKQGYGDRGTQAVAKAVERAAGVSLSGLK